MSHASISHRCAEVVPKLGMGGEPPSTLVQGLIIFMSSLRNIGTTFMVSNCQCIFYLWDSFDIGMKGLMR